MLATSLTVMPVLAADYSDVDQHWAKGEIMKWSDKDLLTGYDGQFNPDASLTRGELAVILDKLFQYTLASQNSFDDLSDTWYTDAILKINKKGTMQGYNNKVRPMDALTRQEAVVLLAKSFNIAPMEMENSFSDNNEIADWAVGYVNAMSKKGYVSGKLDGGFHPQAKITRAEVVKIIDNITGGFYNQAGVYSANAKGTVVVNTPDVTLKDMMIKGDLIIAEGVKDGDFNLENVKISGAMYVYGGGINTITLSGSLVSKIVVDKPESKVRVLSDNKVMDIVVEKHTGLILDGDVSIKDIVAKENSDVEIRKDVNVATFTIDGKNVKSVVDGSVLKLNLSEKATDVVMEGKGKVNTVTNNAGDSNKDLVDAVTGATEKDWNSGSSGGNSGSGGGSTPTTPPTTPTKPTTPPGVKGYTFTVQQSFIGSPVSEIIVYKDDVKQSGYTLYVDGELVATDADNDGIVTTVSAYFDGGIVEYSLDNTTKIALTKVEAK